MVDSRLKIPYPRLFECFVEVTPEENSDGGNVAKCPLGSKVAFVYPDEIDNKERMLKELSMFCYPCKTDSPGVQYFSFVLTDIEHKFRFGFCRYPPHAPTCFCILSYVPWFETFYHILDDIAAFNKCDDQGSIPLLLDALASIDVPEPGSSFSISLPSTEKQTFDYTTPDTTKLPTIPENRNLTDYFASVTPENMIHLFISMLFERRILITSEKLNMLTSVVHGSVSLLYPMQWQHIYIPVLPPHLVNFCCAPMPFLIGVHSSIMEEVRTMPIEDVVIFNVDTNEIESPFPDMETFPSDVSLRLRSKLKRTDKAYGDYVATQFLRALVKVIGGYRDALKFKDTPKGGRIVFDEEAFLSTRSGSIRRFLEEILNLQSFRQFVAGRIDMLNDDIIFEDVFELELSSDVGADKSKFQKTWVSKMKRSSDALGRKVGHRYLNLKAKANDMELKTKMRSFYKDAKSGVRTGYKGAKAQIKEVKHKLKAKDEDDEDDTPPHSPANPVRRQSSLPASQIDVTVLQQQHQDSNAQHPRFRHSVYSTLPVNRVHRKGSGKRNTMSPAAPKPRRPPPRPPRPHLATSDGVVVSDDDAKETTSTSSTKPHHPRLLEVASMPESHSEPSIATLIDLQEDNEYRSSPELRCERDGDVVGRSNMAFNLLDDDFHHIDDYDKLPPLETRSLGATPPPLLPLSSDPHSSSASLSLDVDNDDFVYVASNNEIVEGSLDSLAASPERQASFPGKRHMSYKTAVNPMFQAENAADMTSATSLFSETFFSMSSETRNLFFNGSIDSSVGLDTRQTNPFHPDAGDEKTRSSDVSNVAAQRRPPPSPPKSQATDGNSTPIDPFADLITQTKNSLNMRHSDVI